MSAALRRPRPLPDLWVCQLGTVPYRDALAIQERVRERRQAGELPDTLLLLEHPPVYTRGRRSADAELPLGEDFYRAQGIDVITTDRGGRVTYHGPGQLVGYPIMRIDDVQRLPAHDGGGDRRRARRAGDRCARTRYADGPDYTGVWVGERKIASIGVHVSRGVTTHGFAVNVANDLEPFCWVVACGLPGVSMTSIAEQLDGAAAAGVGLLPQGDGLPLLRGACTAPAPGLAAASRHRHHERRRARGRASPRRLRPIPADAGGARMSDGVNPVATSRGRIPGAWTC